MIQKWVGRNYRAGINVLESSPRHMHTVRIRLGRLRPDLPTIRLRKRAVSWVGSAGPDGRSSGRVAKMVVLACALLVTTCSSDDSALPDPPSTATSESAGAVTTGSDPAPAGDGLVDRYRAFWDARFEANSDPVRPDLPALRELATGVQLDNVIAETQRNAEEGLAFRRPDDSVYERRVVVVERGGGVATLQDCVTNDGIVYRVADGQVVDDEVVTRNISATMRKVDGVWKLAATSEVQEWEGVAGCALSGDF